MKTVELEEIKRLLFETAKKTEHPKGGFDITIQFEEQAKAIIEHYAQFKTPPAIGVSDEEIDRMFASNSHIVRGKERMDKESFKYVYNLLQSRMRDKLSEAGKKEGEVEELSKELQDLKNEYVEDHNKLIDEIESLKKENEELGLKIHLQKIAFEDIIHDISPQSEGKELSEWISVEERLPSKKEGTVLIFNGDVQESKYDFSHPYYGQEWGSNHENVTHWMPLPKAPEI